MKTILLFMNIDHPAFILSIGIAVVLVLTWILWPKKGALSLLSRSRLMSRRILLEDALKYIYDCEYNNLVCGLNSLAGRLKISPDKTTKLLEKLNMMGLITMQNRTVHLTDTGRSYSLRIIRVHRIWEKYLAEETGITEKEWHGEADLLEHSMSLEAANKLAAKLNNPVYDPHGDPIPSPKGELPQLKGKPLSSLKEGDVARIIHIEDEPQIIYEQLLALGLYPGMQVYILDVDNGKIVFDSEGEECVLTSLFASSITVELQNRTEIIPKHTLLSSLEVGEQAEIVGISPNCRGQQRRRLMDLGIVPGSTVKAELRSTFGDPVGYRIMGAMIGVRRDQANMIFIRKNND